MKQIKTKQTINIFTADKCNLRRSVRKERNNLYCIIYIINNPPIKNYNDRLFDSLGYSPNITPPLNFKKQQQTI